MWAYTLCALERTVDGDAVKVDVPRAGHATGMIPRRLYAAYTFDSTLVGILVGETWGMGARELGGEVVAGEGRSCRLGGGGHASLRGPSTPCKQVAQT